MCKTSSGDDFWTFAYFSTGVNMLCCKTCDCCNFGLCTRELDHVGRCFCTYSSCVQSTEKEEKHQRPNWHESWMETAHVMSKRSYDLRLKVGAIIVAEDNTTLLSVGYNGNYAGGPNTPESLEPGLSGFLHAELNAIIKCPYHYPVKKVMYVTHSPCRNCSKLIINAGISRVIYDIEYRDTSGLDLIRSVGIPIEKLSELVVQR
jgi:dCMP deaminase